ncbi:MAG: nodulation protein NfeD [Firmicutes bacterium]|nr:nodulation protein NfeD [Bacillota bacterium]
MKVKKLLLHLLLVIFAFSTVLTNQVVQAQTQPKSVYVLSIDGTIELGLAQYVVRGLELAKANDAAVLLEINTFGGRVDAAVEICDLIFRMETPVIAFIRERAISAGALIAISAPHIAMAPGSTIGAAEPQPLDEKTVSFVKAEFASSAERNGKDPKIAEAMVDADIAIEGLVDKDKILTLTAVSALKHGYTDIISSYRTQVLDHYGLADLEIVEIDRNWAESVAGFVTEPTVSQLLLTLGFLGLVVELITPGWGIPGTIGVVSMALFFGGRILSGLAGFEVVLFFLLGLVLLCLELFVIPGFGIVGILGLASIFGSIFLSFKDFYMALSSIIIALIITVIIIILFWNKFRKSSAWRRFVLVTREDKDLGYHGVKDYSSLLGKTGVAISPLRPAGTVIIDNQRYDVVSDGGFIAADTEIKVVFTEGNRIIVTEVSK